MLRITILIQLFIILLSIQFLNAQNTIYVNSVSGKNTTTCGTSTNPCATLSYIFSPSYGLQDDSIINLSTGTYDCTWMSITQSSITIQSQDNNNRATLTLNGEEGIQISGDNFILKDLDFLNSNTNNSLISIITKDLSITIENVNFGTINANTSLISTKERAYNIEITNSNFNRITTNLFLFKLDAESVVIQNFFINFSTFIMNPINATFISLNNISADSNLEINSLFYIINSNGEVSINNFQVSNHKQVNYDLIQTSLNNTSFNAENLNISNSIAYLISISSDYSSKVTINEIILNKVTQPRQDELTGWFIFAFAVNPSNIFISNVVISYSFGNFINAYQCGYLNLKNITFNSCFQSLTLTAPAFLFNNLLSAEVDDIFVVSCYDYSNLITNSGADFTYVSDVFISNNLFISSATIFAEVDFTNATYNNIELNDNQGIEKALSISHIRSATENDICLLENSILSGTMISYDCALGSSIILQNNSYSPRTYCTSIDLGGYYGSPFCHISGSDVIDCTAPPLSNNTYLPPDDNDNNNDNNDNNKEQNNVVILILIIFFALFTTFMVFIIIGSIVAYYLKRKTNGEEGIVLNKEPEHVE